MITDHRNASETDMDPPKGHDPRPFAVFGAVWLAAVGFLALRGEWSWVGRGVGVICGLGLFVWITILLTRVGRAYQRPGGERDSDGRVGSDIPGYDNVPRGDWRRGLAQLILALALATLASLRFHPIPGWRWFIDLLYAAGRAFPIPNPNYLVNPVLYAVLPGLAALALGARWREIGFGKGWRPWRVIALWCAPVLVVWAHSVAVSGLRVGRILSALVSHTLQNGFMEEFLWRGLVQTRIALLWSRDWGLVLASLLFGWWHIDAVTGWSGNDWWLAGALNVVVQAPMGLALGVIFDRTGNLLAPSLIHAVVNATDL